MNAMNINSKCSLAKQLKRLIAVTCNWEKNDNNCNEFFKNGNDYICMMSSFFPHKCLSHVLNTRADGTQQNQTGTEQYAIPFRFA